MSGKSFPYLSRVAKGILLFQIYESFKIDHVKWKLLNYVNKLILKLLKKQYQKRILKDIVK